jgi:hypothetical protein
MKKILQKLYRHLAISFLLRKVYVEWTALSILLALGVVKEIMPMPESAFSGYITTSLLWLCWVKREEVRKIIAEYKRRGYKLTYYFIFNGLPP